MISPFFVNWICQPLCSYTMLLILNYRIVFITKISGHLRNNYIGNPIKLDCDDHCTTINIINSKKRSQKSGFKSPITWDGFLNL